MRGQRVRESARSLVGAPRRRLVRHETARYRRRFGPAETTADHGTCHRLAVCAVFRNEAPYLAEWIAFHRVVGVEHFYLYDDRSEDDPDAVLAGFIDSGIVTLHRMPDLPRIELNRQPIVYNACLEDHGHSTRWLAFLDLDEFLYARDEDDLRDVLDDFSADPAVAVNWIFYTTSGHVLTPTGLVLENYRDCGDEGHAIYKLIVQPAKTVRMTTAHHGLFAQGALPVSGGGESVAKPTQDPPHIERLRINHYWSKSVEECLMTKMARGALLKSTAMREVEHLFYIEREFCGGSDDSILRFLPAVRDALGIDDSTDVTSADSPTPRATSATRAGD